MEGMLLVELQSASTFYVSLIKWSCTQAWHANKEMELYKVYMI